MEMTLEKQGSTIAATLLITGCCIGAGMIGLPIMSAAAGFIPSTLAMILCYFFATSTGLLILEITLWFDQKVNLLSMANFALGKTGKVITWSLFLFLFYCLFVAYIDGSGQIITNMLSNAMQHPISREVGILCSVSFVGVIVYGGTRFVSSVSRIFLFGLSCSYITLLSLGFSHVKQDKLLYMNFEAAISTIPILLVCFGYQNLIPTLTYYVRKNIKALRTAIYVGNLIPFVIYLLWNFVILGMLPETNSIEFTQMSSQNNMVTELLEKASESDSVIFFAKIFSFLAIITPFIANTMAFVDFLKDGLKISKKYQYEFFIYGLVLIPPTVLTIFYPHLFLKALGFAGGFADVILFGVLPVSIVWIGRYIKNIKGPYTVAGGKSFLITILFLSIGFLLI
ncbi:MAG: tyrosine transporter [Parachlamydiaceae bacterium]|nr:tyrosine transporter [Parachlamydiaceae bacterium]